MSSPPFETVIATTERIDVDSFLIFFSFVSGNSLRSINLLIPIIIGMSPKRPKADTGMAKTSNEAIDGINTSKVIPTNCPVII